jgi:hypothetical protein
LVFQRPAAGLDHLARRDVVGVARDEDGVDTQSVRNRERGTKHRGRVTETSGGRAHVVADVPADLA